MTEQAEIAFHNLVKQARDAYQRDHVAATVRLSKEALELADIHRAAQPTDPPDLIRTTIEVLLELEMMAATEDHRM